MSNRKNSHFKTATSLILTMLDTNELSFRELFWNLHEDEKALSQDIKKLVADGIISRKFHNNNITYARVHHTRITQILHRLELHQKQAL